MNIEENETVKSYFTCSLLSFLGFWLVSEPFRFLFCFFRFSSSYHSQKEGRLETPTVAEHTRLDSITLISGKSQSPEILLKQGKVGTLFYHSNSVKAKQKPKRISHFSHQNRPRQWSRTIAPQAGVGRYCFRLRVSEIYPCRNLSKRNNVLSISTFFD